MSAHDQRPKHPDRVAAGVRRQQQLREQLGDDGYRDYQRKRHADALARHPDLYRRAAAASNAAQIATLGVDGYYAQRRDAYAAAIARHGTATIHRHITAAHEERRRYRLRHPTRGEQLLRTVAAAMGLAVILPWTRFDYLAWRDDPTTWSDMTGLSAIVEASVGPYACDLLIPARQLVIEVLGGIHILQHEADARRRLALHQHGLQVIELTDTPTTPLTELRVRSALLHFLY